MIKINKPSQWPEILLSKGKTRRATLCRNYTCCSPEYISGDRTFNFDAAIYAHPAVKQALVQAQHKKCCFCEVKIGLDGDVEHFRPKGASCQGENEPLIKPGYYWLAYDWTNLLLACSTCNSRYKKNYFPLANPTRRARSHHDDLAQEQPLFINPAQQDPELFISFHEEIPYAIDDNAPGRTTIGALGLAREIQNERRRDVLETLRALNDCVRLFNDEEPNEEKLEIVTSAKEILRRSVEEIAQYAAMARANRLNVF